MIVELFGLKSLPYVVIWTLFQFYKKARSIERMPVGVCEGEFFGTMAPSLDGFDTDRRAVVVFCCARCRSGYFFLYGFIIVGHNYVRML